MNDEKSEEYLNQWQKRLQNLGQNTEIIGYLSFIVSGYVLATSVKSQQLSLGVVIAASVFSLIISFYLVFSGRYLHYSPGKATNVFLYINAFILLLLASGIIPLLVLVSTIYVLTKYRKDNKELTNDSRNPMVSPWYPAQATILIILLIIGCLGYGLAIKNTLNPATTQPSCDDTTLNCQG